MRRATKGTGQVFSFTLTQMLKSKGLIVSMIFMILVALLVYPIKSIIDSTKSEHVPTDTTIETLLVLDETPLKFMDWFSFEKAGLDRVEIPKMQVFEGDYEKEVEKMKESEADVVLLRIRQEVSEGTYYFTFVRSAKSNVAKSDVNLLNDAITSEMKSQLIAHMNVSDEQMALLQMTVETDTQYIDLEKLEENDPGEEPGNQGNNLNMIQYTVSIGVLCITIMLVTMCAEYIASAIVMEKSSKVVEYLLTSVRPMALLCGKVLAVILIVVGQIIAMLLAAVVSILGYHVLSGNGGVSEGVEVIKGYLSVLSGVEASPAQLLVIIPLIICGVLFYSMIGGVIAAGVKSVEELQEGMKTFTMFLFIGAYGSMAVVIIDLITKAPDVLRYICYFLPITSVFLLPGYLLGGKASLWMAVVALVIALVAVVFMFMFAARVYEYLMYYRGQKLKLKDYLSIYKQEKGGKKHE